jgi:rhodanese-related sulfurtransferase
MDRVFEFIGNHPLLVSSFIALLIAFVITESQRGGRRVSGNELSRLVNQQDARVIDIRNAQEFREGHITGSINVPYSQVNERAAELVKLGKPIIVVCALGQVASAAAKTLKLAGATDISFLGDGISGWRQQGLPLVR